MALVLPTPFGWPDDTTGGTTAEDMQRIIASKYEPRVSGNTARRGGIIRHAGWSNDGNGVQTREDATLWINDGVVVLDVALNRCVEAVIPANPGYEIPLQPGTAGTVTVYVAPPSDVSNNAILDSTTSTVVDPSWVVLDRFVFPSGWTKTSQATRSWDRVYAVLFAASLGTLSKALDNGGDRRVPGSRYKRLAQSFVLPTDSRVTLALSSTIRAIDGNGKTPSLSYGTAGSVHYALYVDGIMQVTWERTIDAYATTTYWETMAELTAGRHDVWVESYAGPAANSGWTNRWEVVAGGDINASGDSLQVRHEGVRA